MTNKKKFLSPLIGLLSLILIFSQFALVRLASAQEDQLLSEQQAVEALNGPVFLDAYWADRTSPADATTPLRKEVGPGDGTSTLAVALANRGTSDITAVTGTLTLPDGFSAYGAGGGGQDISPVYMPTDLLYVWSLSVGLSLLAGIYPAWKASRLEPIVALRRE